ncbi:hypothetical protein AAG906_022705 [Vitis piasezkii]
MWSGLVKTTKEGGIDVIETYVFGMAMNFLRAIITLGMVRSSQVCEDCSTDGMYLILRFGSFVVAEWNFGVKKIKMLFYDIVGFLFGCITCLELFWTNSEPFNVCRRNVDFMTLVVNIMKKEKLFITLNMKLVWWKMCG